MIAAIAVVVLAGAGVGAAAALRRAPVVAPTASPAPSTTLVRAVGDGPGVEPGTDGRVWTGRLAHPAGVDVLGADGFSGVDGGSALITSVDRIAPGATDVVVFSGVGDRTVPSLRLLRSVTSTLEAVQHRAPGAHVLLVGPVTSAAELPADLTRVRAVLRSAAAGAGATFVDPVQEKWFADGRGLSTDGRRLTPTGEMRLATGLAPLLTP